MTQTFMQRDGREAAPGGARRRSSAALVLLVLVCVPAADGQPPRRLVESPILLPGDEFTATLPEPRTFRYICHIHPWMEGNVTIEAGNASGMVDVRIVEGASWGYAPENVTVTAGQSIRWRNTGNFTHDVSEQRPHLPQPDGGATQRPAMVAPLGFLIGLVALAAARRRARA